MPDARIAQILSTGSYVPDRVITNAEMDEILGEPTSEWLVANVGIRARRWMSPEQTTSDLIVAASGRAKATFVRTSGTSEPNSRQDSSNATDLLRRSMTACWLGVTTCTVPFRLERPRHGLSRRRP